ncbi:MAG: hypothetical protein H7Z40_08775 [Phycisphaerae bacterium]|nr:hypothetical protein [Gemmatimonadaceae bacterium]
MGRTLLLLAVLPTVVAACGSSGPAAIVTPPAPTYVAGQSYFGKNDYIEYIAGNAPIILTAPHGGSLAPAAIPDRTTGPCGGAPTTVTDLNTRELVRAMQQQYFARFGKYPHVIIANLARRKLDVNRRPPLATCGNTEADAAYAEWHKFIDVAKQAAITAYGKGWYLDMHGHGHAIQRLELGYLLSDNELNLTDATLDASRGYEESASIRTLSQFSSLSFSALLRGATSLGTLYTNNGFPAIPSQSDPAPLGAEYFDGGDNTRRHGCGAEATPYGGTTGGNICGLQIEVNFTGVRDNAANRDNFGAVTARVLEQYLQQHWNLRLAPP